MVKFVFNANRPMWVGLFMLLAAVALFFVSLATGIDVIRLVAIGVGILGAIFYLIGRVKQLWEKRY